MRQELKKRKKKLDVISVECISCLINQVYATARFAALTEDQTVRILEVANQAIQEARVKPMLVQHIVRRFTDKIIDELGESPQYDIYSGVKKESNEFALSFMTLFQQKIDKSESPLETGLQIAAAGNIIDFGAKKHGSINLEKELQTLEKTFFEHYDIEAFKKKLENASKLLYICDNCGEIVMDMLFIKQLKREYPNLEIIAALRDKPIINDATLKDAKAIGMDRLVKVISSGSIYPGTILSETTKEFQELFVKSPIIISKGQGNFETLMNDAHERLFFIFRVKCEYIASISRCKKDSLVLIQGPNILKQ